MNIKENIFKQVEIFQVNNSLPENMVKQFCENYFIIIYLNKTKYRNYTFGNAGEMWKF